MIAMLCKIINNIKLFITNTFAPNETLYYNGTIITMDDNKPTASAMLIRGKYVVAVGGDDVLAQKTNKTIMIDLQGKTIVPGFIESHTHPDLSTFMYDFVDLSGFTHTTNEEVWMHLRDAVRKYKPGEWIVCKGLDHMLIPDLKTPNITFLDTIAPNNPLVIISQAMHSYWANTQAFTLANIDKYTYGTLSSYYEKDTTGNLTGLIVEQSAFAPIRKKITESISIWKIIMNTRKVMTEYIKNGNTTIVTAGLTVANSKLLYLYKFFATSLCRLFTGQCPRHFLYLDHIASKFLPTKNYLSTCKCDNFFNIIGVKMWYDGSPYVGSMYMSNQYSDAELTKQLHIMCNSKNKGLIKYDKLAIMIEQYNNLGWKILVHAQGDLAIKETLNAFDAVSSKNNLIKLRHRLEHCLMLNDESIDRMRDVHITPSFHINHIYYYGNALSQIIGDELTQSILPVKSYAKCQNMFSLHSDSPMFNSEPLSLIATAVTRKTRDGKCINEKEKICINDAIKAMTIMAAWQIGMDNYIGSLLPGKYADFVILDKNPLDCNVDDIRNIKVVNTFINGIKC